MISPLFSLLALKPVQKSTVSVYNQKYLEEEYHLFREKDLSGTDCPIIMVDALYEDVRIGTSLEKAAVIVVTGIDKYGYRVLLDIAVTLRENRETYQNVLSGLKRRGLKTPELVISDANLGIRQAVRTIFVGSLWQRCAVHLVRETLKRVSQDNKRLFYSYIRRCYQAQSRKESQAYLDKLCLKFGKTEPYAVKMFKEGAADTFTFHEFSSVPYYKIYSTNIHERLNRSIRHRTRNSEQFPDEASYSRLVVCWLKFFCPSWERKRYLQPEQMLSVRKSGENRRVCLEKETGTIQLKPSKALPETSFFYICCIPQTIKTGSIKNQTTAIVVVKANKKEHKQVIGYELITGLDDFSKYNNIVETINNNLNTCDYLIVTEYGYPDLENILESNFSVKHIQYTLASIPAGVLAFIPPQVLKSVKEIMNVFNYPQSQEFLEQVFNSLVQLWQNTLPQAALFLIKYQGYLFNFSRFKDFEKAATLKETAEIRREINKVFGLAKIKSDYYGINSKISSLVNQLNEKWNQKPRLKFPKALKTPVKPKHQPVFKISKSKSKRSKSRIPVSKIKPPRITPEMDEKWLSLLRNSRYKNLI